MSTVKDRNGMDLTEAEDTKKRWHEYTEELYKKDLHNTDNHDGVITHLEPDILECKVKWALGSITTNKVSGGDGIPVELFQIRWCCESAFKVKVKGESHSVVSDSLQPRGILQARILEWEAFPFSSGSSWPRNRTTVSCTASGFFTNSAIREAQ